MQRILNTQLDRRILNHLGELYSINEKRIDTPEAVHLSSLVYCLTRSFFNQTAFTRPTDEEVLLFSIGYGLQDVLQPTGSERPTYHDSGIVYRPDGEFEDLELWEMKSTRKHKDDLPDTWLEYIKGGCYIRKQNSYNLSVLHIIQPRLMSETLIFEPDELKDNWEYLMARKDTYVRSLKSGEPPQPYEHNKTWECAYCKNKLMCQAVAGLRSGQDLKSLYEEA